MVSGNMLLLLKRIMNKKELCVAVSQKSGLTRADAAKAVNSAVEAITEALKNGEKVTIPGFGSLEVITRAGREGRNPATGEAMQIPASRTVRWHTGATLKAEIQ